MLKIRKRGIVIFKITKAVRLYLANMFTLYRLTIGVMGIILVSFIGGFFIYQYLQKKNTLPEHIQKNQNIEKKSSIFTIYDLNKKAISLFSLKNKIVIINFWATWCAPCIEELPSLNTLAGYYPKNLVILAVSNESTDDIYNFLMAFPRFHPNFIPANIEKAKMLATFSVQAFPETYILNRQGQLTQKIIGQQKWNSDEWKNKIKTLIEE